MAYPTGRRAWVKPRIKRKDVISRLAWECLVGALDKLEEVTQEREIWASLLPHGPRRKWINRLMED